MALSTFNFQSSIKDVQNNIIASNIKSASGMDMLRSEESIRDLIKSYTDRFQAVEGMLTDVSKLVATSKTVIKVDDFNHMFEGVYIDLSALYSDLGLVDNILNLNLARNKSYFLVIKKKVRELWQRLRLTRQNIFDLNPADESFYETFYSNVNIDGITNIVIDKKMGFVSLQPVYSKIHNKSFEIKNIYSTVYPVQNEDAGVLVTSSILNNLSGNYTNGTRDMLENGLWKEEVSCSEMPDMILNIGDPGPSGTLNSSGIMRNYQGVVAVVDIEFTYPVDINRLDLDIFGDKVLDIDTVLYKSKEGEIWQHVQKVVEDTQKSWTPLQDIPSNTLKDRGFDVVSFMNVTAISAKFLRIVFNQLNYSLINSPNTNSVSIDNKIDTDLSERRYDLLKFNSSLESDLTTPVNDENQSLYAQIVAAIESTRDIDSILQQITDILVPPLKIVTSNFSKLLRFELGTWSIEPKYQEYTPLKGIFKTMPFTLIDRHLIGASLTVNQEIPNGTTSNWYVSIGGKDIPAVESNKFWRTEPINFIDMTSYTQFSTDIWSGSFFLLDLPIDAFNVADNVGIYENGQYIPYADGQMIFLNSRLVYLDSLTNASKKNFAIRYPVSQYNCCNLYVLQPKTDQAADVGLTLGFCSSRRDILESFIKSTYYNNVLISSKYSVTNALADVNEAQGWFGTTFSNAIFADTNIATMSFIPGDTGAPPSYFLSVTSPGLTKTSATAEDIHNYLNDVPGGIDLDIISKTSWCSNVIPLSNLRTI